MLFQYSSQLAFGGIAFSQDSDANRGRVSDTATPEYSDGFQSADNFHLMVSSTIKSLTWYGFHAGDRIAAPETDNFYIQFFTDVGGLPSATPFASRNVGNAVNRIDTGIDTLYGCRQFQYSANIPDTWLEANTTYYLSILADQTTTVPFVTWLWVSSNSPDPGDWYRMPIDVGDWNLADQFPMNHAFTLSNSSLIPEPPAAVLFLTCCIGPAVVRRRK